MEILKQALLFLHFIGLASLLGGFMTQLSAAERRVTPAMLHGVATQLVTGIALVGVSEALPRAVNHPKVGVKLLVTLAVFALVWLYRRNSAVANGVFFGIGGLTVLNVAVAVFWT
jgi:hypothetical protein